MGLYDSFASAYTPTPVGGDSMTRSIASLNNSLGSSGTANVNAGNANVNAGVSGMSPVMQYYQSILRGGPAAQQAMAPQTSQINSQFNQAEQQNANLYGRSGLKASTGASLPFQKIAQTNQLYQSLMPQAAQGLQSASGQQAQIGLGQESAGLQGLTGALNANLQQRSQNNDERGQDLGFLAHFF